jgi:competence protein ComEC
VLNRPLLTWAAAFAAGIGLGAFGWLPQAVMFGLFLLGFCAAAFSRRPALCFAGLVLLGVGAGGLRLAAFQTRPLSDISHHADSPVPVTLVGTILSDPEVRRGGRLTLFLRAETLTLRGQTSSVTGDVSVGLGPEAAGGQLLDYGDRVRLVGRLETPIGATNPEAFSWRDYLARRGVYCQLRVNRPGAAVKLGASRLNPFVQLAWAVRRRMLTALHASLPPVEAAVLGGILIGHRTDLPPDLMADFIHTGTVHILASAGLHVGIVAFWLDWLGRKLTLPRKWGAALSIGVLWLYALMAGGRPSVTRAVLIATIYFGALLFEREPDLPTAIGAAALIILLRQPTALLEPGFQMSFVTILILVQTMPVWDSFWRPRITAQFQMPQLRRVVLRATDLVGLSLFAQLGAIPLVATDYNQLSLTGWLANLLVVPTLFLLIPLGFAGALLWSFWHMAGGFLLSAAGLGITGVVRIVRLFGESPWSYRAIQSPPLPLLLCFYAVLYGVTDALSRRFAPKPAPLSAPPAAHPPALVGDSSYTPP